MTTHSSPYLSRLPRVAGALGVLLLAAACGGSSSAVTASTGGGTGAAKSAPTVVKTATTSAGKILVDAQGRTMYAFAADSKGHSNCTGSCLTYWPAVPAGAKAPAAGTGSLPRSGRPSERMAPLS